MGEMAWPLSSKNEGEKKPRVLYLHNNHWEKCAHMEMTVFTTHTHMLTAQLIYIF